MEKIPSFLVRLATQVDWEHEQNCFSDICSEISELFGLDPWLISESKEKSDDRSSTDLSKRREIIEESLFPKLKSAEFLPSKDLSKSGVVMEVASLEQLYKVFERC
jgi:DNA mismatch repair protein MLH1